MMPLADTFARPHRIVVCTLNARFSHASLGLRYLLANMPRYGGAHLAACTQKHEATINQPVEAIVKALLAQFAPPNTDRASAGVQILGLGVYIWNAHQSLAVVQAIHAARPDIKIILGGPEVSHEVMDQTICQLADYVITGWGDVSFPKLCRALCEGHSLKDRPLQKVIAGEQPPLDEINLPYAHFSDTDLAQRVLYVEASRGCPFKCEFCLSSLDKTAWAFPLDAFLDHLDALYLRGARHFKFVDRTFNLKIDTCERLLTFFLDRLSADSHSGLQLHFELIPDHLPERLRTLVARFPVGVLQFEVGIQSFNPAVQATISRKQDLTKTLDNLRWLIDLGNVHLHTDLIFGLPGETLDSFAAGFDQLYALGAQEIQLGLLKRLRGTPIARHTAAFGMVYDTAAPYALQYNHDVSAAQVTAFARMARYWDVLANSGRFVQSVALLLGTPAPSSPHPSPQPTPVHSPFWALWRLSQWAWQRFARTHAIAQEDWVDALFDYLTTTLALDDHTARHALLADYLASGARAKPACLADLLTRRALKTSPSQHHNLLPRQAQHLRHAQAAAVGVSTDCS